MKKTNIDYWKKYTSGDIKGAVKQCVQALIDNNGIDLLHIVGISLMDLRRREEGLALLIAAATLMPDAAHIYSNAAFTCEQAGMIHEVTFFTEKGLQLFPFDENLLNLKANNEMVKTNFDTAATIYQDILSRNPNHIQSLINLGNIHRAHDRFTEAELMFNAAAQREPDRLDIIYAKAGMYCQQGEDDQAINILQPIAHLPDAQFLLAMCYLSKGDYDIGWRLYQSRFNSNILKPVRHDAIHQRYKPFDHWTEAQGKNVAVMQEGGLGDNLMFARYIPLLAAVTKSLTLYVPDQTLRLLQHNWPDIDMRINHDDAEYDYMTTDYSMPWHFRTTIDSIPASTRYLTVPPEHVKQHRLPPTLKRRVGVCWAGGARENMGERSYDIRRSISLDMLAPFAHPDLEFVSLQLGPHSEDTGLALRRPLKPTFDMLDTAAIVEQLDLVITVDTAMAHLAAAMGKPTWLLSRYDACWRWLHNQPRSPWYPTIRVFGQPRYKDWDTVIDDVTKELHAWL